MCSKLHRTFGHIKRQRLPSPLHDQAYSIKCWDAQTCSLPLDVVTTSSLYSGSPFKLSTVFSFLPPLNANALASVSQSSHTWLGEASDTVSRSHLQHQSYTHEVREPWINSSAGTNKNDRLLKKKVYYQLYWLLGSLPYFNSTGTLIYLLCEDSRRQDGFFL